MRGEFEKVKRPHEYKGAYYGTLKIPITIISKNGETETSDSWSLDQNRMHPIEVKHIWANDAFNMLYKQTDILRFRTPEVLHCFETLGGRLFITEGTTDDYFRHILGLKDVSKDENTFTYGFAMSSKHNGDQLRDVCVDSRGVFHDLNGRGAEYTTFIHEIVHVTDVTTRGDDPIKGRFSFTDLMKALINIEINTRPFSVSADIYNRISDYSPAKQLQEYLPRLFQQYVQDVTQRDPKKRKLSDLETAFIEKAYLPDCKLRANGEIAKAAILNTEYSRSMEEILMGAEINNKTFMIKELTRNPPKKIHYDYHMTAAAKDVRAELLAFIDNIPEQAAQYCMSLERRRNGQARESDYETHPA